MKMGTINLALSVSNKGSGCGSVGIAVASDTIGPRFEFSHWQKFVFNKFTVNCIEKRKIKKKVAWNGPSGFVCAFHPAALDSSPNLCFFQFIFELCHVNRTTLNKKEAGISSFKKQHSIILH